MTLLLVTHDTGVVGYWVNRVACLNRTLVYHGAPGEILTPGVLSSLYGMGVRPVAHLH